MGRVPQGVRSASPDRSHSAGGFRERLAAMSACFKGRVKDTLDNHTSEVVLSTHDA